MKSLIFLLMLVISVSAVNAQEQYKKNRSELKAEKNAIQAEMIKNLIENKSFVFVPNQVIMKDKSAVDLSYYYSLKIEKNQVTSFLPFYSTVYENEIEIQNSPFYFEQPIISYDLQKENDLYLLNVETLNDQTAVVFKFRICKLGHTSLKVTSTNRSCISFRGIIKETDEIQAVK